MAAGGGETAGTGRAFPALLENEGGRVSSSAGTGCCTPWRAESRRSLITRQQKGQIGLMHQ